MCAEYFNGKIYYITHMYFNLKDIWNEVSGYQKEKRQGGGGGEERTKLNHQALFLLLRSSYQLPSSFEP